MKSLKKNFSGILCLNYEKVIFLDKKKPAKIAETDPKFPKK